MGMVVIQPYILVSKLKKTKTKFLRYTGYLNSIKHIKQDLLLILVLVRQQKKTQKELNLIEKAVNKKKMSYPKLVNS